MANTNSKRLLINLILLAVIGGLIFLVINHKEDTGELYKTLYDESIGDEAKEIIIHAEGQDDVVIQREDKVWRVTKPSSFIADKEKVRHLFTVLSENAESSYETKDKDLTKYGLDKDRLSVSFNGVKLIFGNYNEVTSQRYILKSNRMYLVSETVAGLMMMGEDGFKPQPKPKMTTTRPTKGNKPKTENK